jgi:signal transduction histidine kinase
VSVALGLWFSGRLTSPVKTLTRGVNALKTGNWRGALPVQSRDEFGELTAAFNNMADELTHQEKLRRQMVADIAHDLRTPLSVMTLEVEAIRDGLQTPAEAADSLEEEITWLRRLVEDLHTLAMMDAKQMQLYLEPGDIAPFLCNVAAHWAGMAAKAGRELRAEIPDALPLVNVDAHRMRQILGNLLNNALQHTPPGTGTLMRATPQDGGVAVSVIDHGEGIAPQALPHIFDRFYRGDKSRHRRATGGSGLGLSIAHQLTALHGGKLTVSSPPGEGATFTVWLPGYNSA